MKLIFRWLGAAGVELRAGNQVLVIDPFFTRPTLFQMLQPVRPDASRVAEHLRACNVVLVTHAHYDHLMDVPDVLKFTRAVAFGTANACRLIRLHGVPEEQVKEVRVGDELSLGAFRVEVIAGRHSAIPFGRYFNGNLKADLQPQLRVNDYRMDACLGYCISVFGMRLLVCAAEPQPAKVLFAGAQEPKEYYRRLFTGVQPESFIPIHWDNFTRPLTRPLRRFSRPGCMALWQITHLARQVLPRANIMIPEIFREYTLG